MYQYMSQPFKVWLACSQIEMTSYVYACIRNPNHVAKLRDPWINVMYMDHTVDLGGYTNC